ncbi:MAG: hypothetical protein RI907_3404 [Pseudomonadota bacterium]|jgi:sRNA-binding protein
MSTLPEDQAQAPATAVAPEVADTASQDNAAAAPAAPAADTAQTATQLAERFPALFKGAPKPLKLRIQADIQERAPGVFSKAQLSAFLRRYTGATSYLVAVTRAPHRFDLDGQPGGELTDEHRQVAQEELKRRRERRQAKEQVEAQAQQEALQARRQRAQLLRDHSLTKLTSANFCALKGIAPDQLDALLAQARQEAEEDARAPRPVHDRRGPGGERRPVGDRRDGDRREGGPRRDRDGRGPRKGQGQGGQRPPQGERREPRAPRAPREGGVQAAAPAPAAQANDKPKAD